MDRQQLFDNGAAITGIIQPGITVADFGLQLTQGAAPGVYHRANQGAVGTGNAAQCPAARRQWRFCQLLRRRHRDQLDGSAGGTSAALSVTNTNGNVSITTGSGAISGPTGISASTTGDGILTITTGSGLVTGTGLPPNTGLIAPTFGQGILASTENGALNVTVGSGGVTHPGDTHAI